LERPAGRSAKDPENENYLLHFPGSAANTRHPSNGSIISSVERLHE
jgi:hypothetical protein